ncbi:MAG: GntR family transcriptional regulator [Parvularculaceae bacterium]|nr:FadR family transcriptional regulator [Parvularculaceae bacterium]
MTKAFEPLIREPAYLKVFRAIEARIADGALPDGAHLPTEAELCEQFGVTRSTVREGLRLLEQTGLVQRAGKKIVIKRPDSADIAAAASKSFALGGVTFHEVWDALATLYPEAARLAAKRLSKDDIAALEDTRAVLVAAPADDHEATVAAAVEFFQLIARGLDNRVMLAMLQSLNMMIGESLRQVIAGAPNARARIANAQGELVAAFRAHDADRAADWMAKHIADLKRGYVVAKVDMNAAIL